MSRQDLLFSAITNNSFEVVEHILTEDISLLESRDDSYFLNREGTTFQKKAGFTPLLLAASLARKEIENYLLFKGADTTAELQDKSGRDYKYFTNMRNG